MQQRVSGLEAVLAAAHKYQVARLQRWCEQQLCGTLGVPSVCGLLQLAQLYDAAELERCCLTFMKAHQADIVQLRAFAALPSESLVRFSLFCAGVEPETEAASRKRKRAAE